MRANGVPPSVDTAKEPQAERRRLGRPFRAPSEGGTVFPRRCRGLTREMHLRCARNGQTTWAAGTTERYAQWALPAPQRGNHRHDTGTPETPTTDLDPHTRTPQRGTPLPSNGIAVGTRAPTRVPPNGAPIFHPTASPWEPEPPHAYPPTGHPSSIQRHRRGNPRPHPRTPQRGTHLPSHGIAVGTRAPTRIRPNGAPVSHATASPWHGHAEGTPSGKEAFGTPFQGFFVRGDGFPTALPWAGGGNAPSVRPERPSHMDRRHQVKMHPVGHTHAPARHPPPRQGDADNAHHRFGSPSMYAPSGHASRSPRHRRGDPCPHTRAPQRGTPTAGGENAANRKVKEKTKKF